MVFSKKGGISAAPFVGGYSVTRWSAPNLKRLVKPGPTSISGTSQPPAKPAIQAGQERRKQSNHNIWWIEFFSDIARFGDTMPRTNNTLGTQGFQPPTKFSLVTRPAEQQGAVRVFEDVSAYAGLRASMVANCSCAPLCMVPRSSLYLSISQP